jgi:translation initiation factor IF-2
MGVNILSKQRVYEVAKDLNISSKDVLKRLNEFDIKVKNHMSTMEESEIDIILEIYTQQNQKSDIEEVEEEKTTKKKEDSKLNNKEKQIAKKDLNKNLKKGEARHYDTRPSSFDKEKVDNEKLNQLVPGTIGEDVEFKQKIKKGAGKDKKEAKSIIPTVDPKKKLEKKNKEKKEKIKVLIPDEITVGELSDRLNKPVAEVIKKLMMCGVMATINQNIDYDTASLIAEDFGAIVEKEIIITEEDILINDIEDNASDLKTRSPVVVVMGHVDHGKTSLLDAIRTTNVIASEAGGITQHIGAYRVKLGDREITFLDTPGHEAFTSMRARGAQITDVAILVVAADDGVMPQTVEAINHAKAANIDIIVAINKIDKESSNPDRVKQELTEYGLVAEDWGGNTICVPVSALKREGIENLLEMVLLVSDIQELKANPDRLAKGTVIEAQLDKGRGPVATMLVQNGTLRDGDIILAGTSVGRVRAMVNDKGERVIEAGPSMPVEIIGLSEVPSAGDIFYVVNDERKAREVVEQRKFKIKEDSLKLRQKVSLEDLFEQIKEGQVKDLNIIIKADVQGSVEAIKQSLEKLSNEEVKIKIIHGGVGGVTKSDVMLAAASNAIIIGFNVRPDSATQSFADREEVEIRLYRVIYNAIEEMEAAMKGLLAPKYKEVVLGHSEVRATFKVSGVGTIAGCYVVDGKITRNSDIRVVRGGIVLHEGSIASLKRFKDDVREVVAGYECGIGIERFNNLEEWDILESFEMQEIKQ